MSKGPESKITSRILKWLKEHRPGVWYKIHGGPYQVGGIPDVIGCHDGRFYAFEVKTPKAYAASDHGLSERQKVAIRNLIKSGGRAACVESLDAVKEIMEEWERRER